MPLTATGDFRLIEDARADAHRHEIMAAIYDRYARTTDAEMAGRAAAFAREERRQAEYWRKVAEGKYNHAN